MVESIEELRKTCQAGAAPGKYRKISIYFTKLFLHTPLSANHVSFLGLIVGLTSVYLFSLGQWFHLILGASLLHLFLILDFTDGEVARYRKTAGMSGRYVEGMVHPILRSAIFIGLGLGIFKNLNDFSVVLLIFLTCYSDSLSSVAYFRKMSLLPQHYKIRNASPLAKKLVNKPIGRRIKQLLEFFDSTHTIFNLITLGAVVQSVYTFLPDYNLDLPFPALTTLLSNPMLIILIFYGFFFTFLWTYRTFAFSKVIQKFGRVHDRGNPSGL